MQGQKTHEECMLYLVHSGYSLLHLFDPLTEGNMISRIASFSFPGSWSVAFVVYKMPQGKNNRANKASQTNMLRVQNRLQLLVLKIVKMAQLRAGKAPTTKLLEINPSNNLTQLHIFCALLKGLKQQFLRESRACLIYHLLIGL